MNRIIVPLFGPFAINSFGLMISLGLTLFTILMFNDKGCKKIMTTQQLHTTIVLGVLAALVGARLLAIIGNDELLNGTWIDWISIWDGGLSSLGSVIGVIIACSLYIRSKKIPFIPFFDITAVYLPIIHIFVRIGCFLAGCCYGCPTTLPWGIIYYDADSLAPLGVQLHPTQLYSLAALMVIFLFLLLLRNSTRPAGVLIGWYLFLTTAERALVDFLRGDREFISYGFLNYSVHQLIGCVLALIGVGILVWSYTHRQSDEHYEPL